MLSKARLLLLLLVLGGFFGGAIGRLFILRFEHGDIYPAYSTLRTDPLGTKVFYDAIQAAEGSQVSRNLRALHQLPTEGRRTIFYLGMPRRYFDSDPDLADLDARARAGARLIISFRPDDTAAGAEEKSTAPEKPSSQKKSGQQEPKPPSRSAQWKVRVVSLEKQAPATAAIPGLEGQLSGHSLTAFAPEHPGWRTIYATAGKPVLLERTYGLGSIVLCADSWVFSNEALRAERCPQLLSWLIGANREVVFDETHHGIRENPGIATLARRYHLHAAFGVCLLLGILFVWRNAVPLVPAAAAEPASATIAGRDAAAGLANLLRRSVPAKNMAATCLERWLLSSARSTSEAEQETARALAADPARTPLERYHALTQLLTHARRN